MKLKMKLESEWGGLLERDLRIDRKLAHLIAHMASAWAATSEEAFLALWEADEIIVINGTARLITPTRPNGHHAW